MPRCVERIGGPDILWSVNKLGLFSGLWLCRRSWRLQIDFRENFVHIWKSQSWMCKKQTSVSDSSTESEVVSLDLWDSVIEVLHASSNQPKKSIEKVQGNLLHDTPSVEFANSQAMTQTQYNDLELCNIDFVSSNVKSSHFGAMLYIFEDKEAVIKIIIKGRSSTMRHVSRTHRVALDWLFGRINLDPQIQNQICWRRKPTRRPSFQYQHFQICHLPRNDVEKDATRNRRRENCGKVEGDVEPGFAHCSKLFYSAEFECNQIVRGHSKHPVSKVRISQSVQGNLPLEVQIRMTHVEFSSVAKRCKNERRCEETRCCRKELGSEFSGMSRLPGCAGQSAEAVSAYIQVKMDDAPSLFKIPKSECPDIWIRLPKHKWPKSWSRMEDPVVPLVRNLGLLCERQFEKVLLQYGWQKVSKLGMFIR